MYGWLVRRWPVFGNHWAARSAAKQSAGRRRRHQTARRPTLSTDTAAAKSRKACLAVHNHTHGSPCRRSRDQNIGGRRAARVARRSVYATVVRARISSVVRSMHPWRGPYAPRRENPAGPSWCDPPSAEPGDGDHRPPPLPKVRTTAVRLSAIRRRRGQHRFSSRSPSARITTDASR